MSILSIIISLIPVYYLQEGWSRLIIVGIVSTISIIVFSYLFVLTKGVKNLKILNFVQYKLSRK